MTTTLSRFESLNKTKRRKVDTRSYPYIVDEKNRGTLGLNTEMVVMNVTCDPKHNGRHKVTYFVTENGSLFAGNHTVAVFRIKSLTDKFKAFLNPNPTNMTMDPNAPKDGAEEQTNLSEDTGAGATEEGASEEKNGAGDLVD